MGDLLGEPAPRALAVLDAYARSFPWGGVPFEAGLRSFLDGFRLPGEAQKIYRILDAWSLAFYAANAPEAAGGAAAAAAGGSGEGKGKEEEGRDAAAAAAAPAPDPSATSTTHPAFASADAVHVLAFSAILLNTDAHSASVRTKMTAAQFVANTRGINGGADLPRAFLEGLYGSILAHPVRAPVAAGAGAEEGGPVAAPSPSGRGWEAGGGGERDRGASPPGGASALAPSTSALARLAGPRRSRSGGWGLGSSGAAAAAPPPPSPPSGGGGRPSSAGGWLLGGGGGGKPAGGGAPKRRWWWGGCLGPA